MKLRRYNGATRAWEATTTLEDRGTVDGVQVAIGGGHALVIWYLRTAERLRLPRASGSTIRPTPA